MRFPPMMDIAQNSKAYPDPDAIVRATVLAAMWTATETGALTTSSLDCSSLSENDLIKLISELRQAGYNVTEGASKHITVTWQY
jgi:hypothetical protein